VVYPADATRRRRPGSSASAPPAKRATPAAAASENPSISPTAGAAACRVPQPPVPDPVQLDLFLARLAADGLWLFEATRPAPLGPEVKQALIRRIAALTGPPA